MRKASAPRRGIPILLLLLLTLSILTMVNIRSAQAQTIVDVSVSNEGSDCYSMGYSGVCNPAILINGSTITSPTTFPATVGKHYNLTAVNPAGHFPEQGSFIFWWICEVYPDCEEKFTTSVVILANATDSEYELVLNPVSYWTAGNIRIPTTHDYSGDWMCSYMTPDAYCVLANLQGGSSYQTFYGPELMGNVTKWTAGTSLPVPTSADVIQTATTRCDSARSANGTCTRSLTTALPSVATGTSIEISFYAWEEPNSVYQLSTSVSDNYGNSWSLVAATSGGVGWTYPNQIAEEWMANVTTGGSGFVINATFGAYSSMPSWYFEQLTAVNTANFVRAVYTGTCSYTTGYPPCGNAEYTMMNTPSTVIASNSLQMGVAWADDCAGLHDTSEGCAMTPTNSGWTTFMQWGKFSGIPSEGGVMYSTAQTSPSEFSWTDVNGTYAGAREWYAVGADYIFVGGVSITPADPTGCQAANGYLYCFFAWAGDGYPAKTGIVESAPISSTTGIGTWTQSSNSFWVDADGAGMSFADERCLLTGASLNYIDCVGNGTPLGINGSSYALVSNGVVGTFANTTGLPSYTIPSYGSGYSLAFYSCDWISPHIFCTGGSQYYYSYTVTVEATVTDGVIGPWVVVSQGWSTGPMTDTTCVTYNGLPTCISGASNPMSRAEGDWYNTVWQMLPNGTWIEPAVMQNAMNTGFFGNCMTDGANFITCAGTVDSDIGFAVDYNQIAYMDAPASVNLVTNSTSPFIGQAVKLTASATGNFTGHWINIFDVTNGTDALLNSCYQKLTCTANVTETQKGVYSFQANVADEGLYTPASAYSEVVQIRWGLVPPTPHETCFSYALQGGGLFGEPILTYTNTDNASATAKIPEGSAKPLCVNGAPGTTWSASLVLPNSTLYERGVVQGYTTAGVIPSSTNATGIFGAASSVVIKYYHQFYVPFEFQVLPAGTWTASSAATCTASTPALCPTITGVYLGVQVIYGVPLSCASLESGTEYVPSCGHWLDAGSTWTAEDPWTPTGSVDTFVPTTAGGMVSTYGFIGNAGLVTLYYTLQPRCVGSNPTFLLEQGCYVAAIFYVYSNILGGFFAALLIGAICMAIYIKSENGLLSIFCFFLGAVVCGAILPSFFGGVITVAVALLVTWMVWSSIRQG